MVPSFATDAEEESWIWLVGADVGDVLNVVGRGEQLVGLVPGETGSSPGAALGRLCCQPGGGRFAIENVIR